MRVLLPLLLAGLTACYSPRSVTPSPHTGPYGEVYQEPLRASLWVDSYTSHVSFELNRPAHVAIFAWRPGQQLHMIQPAVGHQMRQHYSAGSHNVWARTGHFATWRASRPQLASSYPGPGPVYYMLIASAEPLHVAPFYGSARMSWAHQVTWSHNVYTATELLATQIVPDHENTEWTVAYHVGWHDATTPLRASSHLAYRWVHCPGGVMISVPIEVWASGRVMCPELQPVPPPDTTAPITPPDTAAPDPTRRAVEPPRRPSRPESMDGARPDAAEFRALLRQIRLARGQPVDDVEAPPVPAWRRLERDALEGGAVVGFARPVIRPASAEYVIPSTWDAPASQRAEQWRGERSGTRSGTRATRAEPAPRSTQRSSPAAPRPSPRAERATPTVERPAPEARRPSPRPRPESTPTREDPRGGG
jgi:hypothetical protein